MIENYSLHLQRQTSSMTFDLITENEKLWAVRYDDCLDNVLDSILGQWNDVVWLRNFFKANLEDLTSYFKITDVNQAIYDTIDDSERLQCLIMDISPEADLDKFDNNIMDKDSFDDYRKEL